MSAFEADRFNRSRTSPREKWQSVACGQGPVTVELLPDLVGAGLLLAVAFPPTPEKRLQQLSAPSPQHAAFHLHAVI